MHLPFPPPHHSTPHGPLQTLCQHLQPGCLLAPSLPSVYPHRLPARCMPTPGGCSSVGRNHTGAHTNGQNPTVRSPSLLPPGVIAKLCWFPAHLAWPRPLSEAAETLLPILGEKGLAPFCFVNKAAYLRLHWVSTAAHRRLPEGGEWGLLLVVGHGLLSAVASLVAEQGL